MKYRHYRILGCILVTLCAHSVFGQSKRVLFIGNSYTYFNGMPNLLSEMGKSTGDIFIIGNNTPGGSSLKGHVSNSATLAKFAEGNWDYVVLQDQSQRPSFRPPFVEKEVFPFAHQLDSLLHIASPCANTVFYMTWGRKNGDVNNCSYFPPLCSYRGMDSILRLNYTHMANDNDALISPVSVVWRYLIDNYPGIELYNQDESHPSLIGSYAAACAFYSTILRKDPKLITFNSTLSDSIATLVKNAASRVVFDDLLKWNIGKHDLSVDFDYSLLGDQKVEFSNRSINHINSEWLIQGKSYSDNNLVHQFSDSGTYTIKLSSFNECDTAILEKKIYISTAAIEKQHSFQRFRIYPNPSLGKKILLTNSSISSIQVFSLFGENMTHLITFGGDSLNVENLEPQTYLIRFMVEGIFYSQRLILTP